MAIQDRAVGVATPDAATPDAATPDAATPDAARVVAPVRQRIQDVAFGLFYARGVRAVGVDAVIAASGVAKASFYRHFPSKDDLVMVYLEVVDQQWRQELAQAAAGAGEQPARRLVGVFDAVITAAGQDGFRGCAVLNTAVEYPRGSPAHDRAVRHKVQVRDWLAELAAAAGARDPDGLALALSLLLDGVLATGAVIGGSDSVRAARRAREAAEVLVAAATGG